MMNIHKEVSLFITYLSLKITGCQLGVIGVWGKSSYAELGKRKVLWPVGREAPKLRS